MEILERQDPEKKKLMDEVSYHKRQLESGAKEVSRQTEKLLANAVIIGATVTLSYLLYRNLAGGSKKSKKSEAASLIGEAPTEVSTPVSTEQQPSRTSKILSDIGNRIAEEATLFLLNMAKEKLIAYLESKKKADIQP
jgi:hypothetical protein